MGSDGMYHSPMKQQLQVIDETVRVDFCFSGNELIYF